MTNAQGATQGERRPRAPNQLGKLTVDISVGEIDDPISTPESKGKNSQAVALARTCGRAEDDSRVRERNAARNFAVLRRIALDLARANGSLKASLKGKRKCAAWDDSFMTKLIAG